MIEELIRGKKTVMICPMCNDIDHVWKPIYYDEHSKLLRLENAYISYCKASKEYVFKRKVDYNI